MMNPKKIIALCTLLALLAGALVLGVQAASLVPRVQEEMRTTPTPTPIYGSTMVITPDPNATPAPQVLKNGSTGEAVTKVQTRLQELGYYTGELDGQFGSGTNTAVSLFQAQHGLKIDGAVGPETSAALFDANAQPYLPPTPSPSPTTAAEAIPQPVVQSVAQRKPYLRPDGLPLLVNREHPLPDDYQSWDLVKLSDYCDPDLVKIKYDDTWAEREAADALMVMLQAAHEEGITVWQVSAAYRTVAYQQQLFDNQVNEYIHDRGMSREKAVSATRKTVADPGTSEHHIGTAFDITVPGVSFAGTEQAKWLAEHCWDYGFILRYTKEKESITGFLAEAWHFRYVGATDAKIMRDENLCLEEYLDKYGLEVAE